MWLDSQFGVFVVYSVFLVGCSFCLRCMLLFVFLVVLPRCVSHCMLCLSCCVIWFVMYCVAGCVCGYS